MTFSSISAI